MPARCALLVVAFAASLAPAQDDKAAKSAPPPKPESKPPTVLDALAAGRKVIVFLYQDFNKIERPNGAFLPGADAARLKDDERKARPPAGGVTRVDVKGDLGDAWATLEVLVEVRIDDPRGGDVPLGFQEAQCSKADLRFHDSAWDASEFVPIDPAPLKKEDVSSPYILRLDKPGSYVLRLTLDVEIDRGPVERQLSLTLPRAPVKNVRLRETAARAGIRVEGARRARTEREVQLDADGQTLLPRLLQDESLDLRWRLIAEGAGKGSDASYSLIARSRVRGRVLETVHEFSVQARRERRDWTIRLPENEAGVSVRVLQNGKPIVATVEALKADDARARVHTAESVVGPIKILLTTNRSLPPIPSSPETAMIEISAAALEDASLGEALALVATKDDEEIRVTPVARAELAVEPAPSVHIDPDALSGGRSAAFQYVRPDGKLPIRLERLRPVLSLAIPPAVTVHFEPTAIDVQVDFRLQVKQGRLESVQAALPSEAQDVRATVDGVACSAASGSELPTGARLWTLAFGERRSGEALLHLSANLPLSGVSQRIAIPYLPDVPQIATTVSLTKSPGVQVVLGQDELKNFQLTTVGQRGGGPVWLSLQTRNQGAILSAAVTRVRGKSAAMVEHRLAAGDGSLHVMTAIRWENHVEPLTDVRFNVPDALSEVVVRGDRLAIPPGGIVMGPGSAKLPLAAPAESCAIAVEYTVPLAKEGPTLVALATPVADSIASCFAELRAQPGKRPLPPPGWEPTAPERHLGELLDPENPYIGLLVRAETPPSSMEWRSEAAGSLAEIVVPRVLVIEEITSAGRRRGRMFAVVGHRRIPVCELVVPPGCTVSETYLDGKPAAALASARGSRPSLSLRLPNDDRPISLEVRYEAACKNLAAARNLSLEIPKFGGDVVVDQVLWRIATPTNCLLASFGEEATAPAPNIWRFDRRLPGEWAFEPALDDGGRLLAWLDAAGGNLEWPEAPPPSFQARRWSFMTWGNDGVLNVTEFREPFWILAASCLVLATVAVVRTLQRRARPWVAGLLGLAVALVWLMSPRAIAWLWIGSRWAVAALTVALVAWVFRAAAKERRRRLAGRSLVLSSRPNSAPPALPGPSASSLKRKVAVE